MLTGDPIFAYSTTKGSNLSSMKKGTDLFIETGKPFSSQMAIIGIALRTCGNGRMAPGRNGEEDGRTGGISRVRKNKSVPFFLQLLISHLIVFPRIPGCIGVGYQFLCFFNLAHPSGVLCA
jgi:hypothetical protein